MTKAEVLTLINTQIVTNGNNEITAEVLNPVLAAIVNQINDLVGNPSNLPIGETNVIDAINSIEPSGLVVLTGNTNPNTTPPSSFNLGDFYAQTLSSVIIAFWQFNGIEWVEVLSREQQKQRNYVYVIGNYNVLDNSDVILYDGTNISDVITFLDASLYPNKEFTIVNISDISIDTSNYTNLSGVTSSSVSQNTVLKVISNGTYWQQIIN